MVRANSKTRYGATALTLHWLSALLFLSVFASGYLAHSAPEATSLEVTRKLTLFSVHKTLGVWIFCVAIIRILWAIGQPRPLPLAGRSKTEQSLSDITYWLLYSAMVLVPLTGWTYHSATTGYAPIWWPFWQDIPFVPKSAFLARLMQGLHYLFMLVFAGSIALHLLGTLKHQFMDRDQTLARMFGRGAPKVSAARLPQAKPALTAVLVWMLALYGATQLMKQPQLDVLAATSQTQTIDRWTVEQGSLGFEISQFERPVQGDFAQWDAQISFRELAPNGSHGAVTVSINLTSLDLGPLTAQALGPDYFDVSAHPVALFDALIYPAPEGYVAKGQIILRGISKDIDLPFRLDHGPQSARMRAELTLNRFDFAIGQTLTDLKLLGEEVLVSIDLTAKPLAATPSQIN